jgi:hypothetical protein
MPRSGMGEEPVLETVRVAFCAPVRLPAVRAAPGKRFEFGARENYEKEFVQFFLPAARSSPAINRAPPATAGESGAVCVGVVIGFSVT